MLRQCFFHCLGLGILFANKVRYAVTGYHRPREFTVADTGRAVRYDQEVIARWERTLKEAGLGEQPFVGKRVLELGPGADLGVGLLLLAKGAASYTGYDKNPLADRAPKILHDAVLKSIPDPGARARAEEALQAYTEKKPTTLIFKQDSSFSFRWLENESVDVVVSNAAFEHFERVPDVLREVGRVLTPGGVFVAQVDLQTHTRIIRERDPLNIYRYPSWLYRLAHFSGIPNRVRPQVYEKTLQKLSFASVDIIPETTIPHDRLTRDRKYMRRAYRNDPTLGVLSFMVVAKK